MSITSHLDLLSAIQPGGRSDIGRELPLPAAVFCEGGLLETHHTASPSTVQTGVLTRSIASEIRLPLVSLLWSCLKSTKTAGYAIILPVAIRAHRIAPCNISCRPGHTILRHSSSGSPGDSHAQCPQLPKLVSLATHDKTCLGRTGVYIKMFGYFPLSVVHHSVFMFSIFYVAIRFYCYPNHCLYNTYSNSMSICPYHNSSITQLTHIT